MTLLFMKSYHVRPERESDNDIMFVYTVCTTSRLDVMSLSDSLSGLTW